MKQTVYHPQAEREAMEAARWYEQQVPQLGARFRVELNAAIARIAQSPEAFGFLGEGIRCHRLHRFPYGVLYRILPERILIVALMHLYREPEYWSHRVQDPP